LAYPEGEFASSDEDPAAPASPSEGDEEEEGTFTLRRRADCEYHTPIDCGSRRAKVDDNGKSNQRLIFAPTSITSEHNGHTYIGHIRRRFGRGGRMVLDRIAGDRVKKVLYSQQESATSLNVNPGNVDSLPLTNSNRLVRDSSSNSVGYVPTPSTSTSANAYSNQQSHVHFRPKPSEPQKPEEVSIDYSSDSDADVDENKFDVHNPFSVNSDGYLGTVVTQGDRPMVYSIESLLSETAVNVDPLPLHVTNSAGESVLLDEESSSLTNANYLTELSSGDLGLEPTSTSWLSTIECMDLGNDSFDLLGHSSLQSLSVNQVETSTANNYSSSRPSSEPMDVDSDVVIVDSDGNSFEIERRRLIDKDNKENDSVSRDEVGENSILISENGDGVDDSSEDCMIVEEAKSSVVNSSRGVSSSSTLLVDTIGMSGSDGHDVSNSLSKNLVDKSRTNSSNSQLLGSKNSPTIIRRLYGKPPRRTDGSNSINSKNEVLLKKGNVNGDVDVSYQNKFNFNEVPLELLSGGEFIPDSDNNVETLEFGLGRSSKNLHLTVNSNTSSNNNSINMVTSSGPGPAKISLSNGPTVRQMPDCEQGSVVR
jgi:hypothetical protein